MFPEISEESEHEVMNGLPVNNNKQHNYKKFLLRRRSISVIGARVSRKIYYLVRISYLI